MSIETEMSGREIDRVLRIFHEAENENNNGMILYIRLGELAFDTEENLFTITPLT